MNMCSAAGATVLHKASCITMLQTKRTEARDGCLKGGLGRRLDQLGSWRSCDSAGASALWGDMAANERPQPNLREDRVDLAKDPLLLPEVGRPSHAVHPEPRSSFRC